MKHPQAFRPTPTSPAPLQQAARIVEIPAPPPTKPKKGNQYTKRSLLAGRRTAALSVRRPEPRTDGEREEAALVTLSKALLQAIPHLKAGSPVELVPPQRRGGTWHLDTRPTAARRLPKRVEAVAKFRTSHTLGPDHFLRSAGIGKPPILREVLYFRLGPELPGHPGYYTLLPA